MKIFKCILEYDYFTVGKSYVLTDKFIDDRGANRDIIADTLNQSDWKLTSYAYLFQEVTFGYYLLQAEECVRERDEKYFCEKT